MVGIRLLELRGLEVGLALREGGRGRGERRKIGIGVMVARGQKEAEGVQQVEGVAARCAAVAHGSWHAA